MNRVWWVGWTQSLGVACLNVTLVVQSPAPLPVERPTSPLVLVVGCAGTTDQPHLWTLSNAGERTTSMRAGITSDERAQAAKRPLGRDTHELIGVADFVDRETARKIGERGKIFEAPRLNTTGMLVSGHRVAVKGLYIDGRPTRINLTSVADLAPRCP